MAATDADAAEGPAAAAESSRRRASATLRATAAKARPADTGPVLTKDGPGTPTASAGVTAAAGPGPAGPGSAPQGGTGASGATGAAGADGAADAGGGGGVWGRLAVVAVIMAVLIGGIVAALALGNQGEDHDLVIPAGTGDDLDGGSDARVLPAVVEIEAGDTLVVRNEDDRLHTFGSVTVRSGETVEKEYPTAGRFLEPTSADPVGEVLVIVTE